MIGFININKKSGVNSSKIVAILKKQFHIDKIGHMGTLDPLASGVLPIAVGKSTRLFDYFLQKTKKYVATFEFGVETDTLDRTGNIINQNDVVLTRQQIESVLGDFIGNIDQLPPNYSAKRVNGRRAYDLARQGVEFELKTKNIFIKSIVLLDQIGINQFTFEIECGSGTYIRSIARDIAYKLNTFGSMNELVRTESGYFKIENAFDIDDCCQKQLYDLLISVDKVFPHIKKINTKFADKLCNGMTVIEYYADDDYFVYDNEQTLIGIGNVKNNKLKMKTFLR